MELRFGASFINEFWGPLFSQFDNKAFTPKQLEDFITGFDWRRIEDTRGEYSLRMVRARVSVTTPSGRSLHDNSLFGFPPWSVLPGLNGAVTNPGTGRGIPNAFGVPPLTDELGNKAYIAVGLEIKLGR